MPPGAENPVFRQPGWILREDAALPMALEHRFIGTGVPGERVQGRFELPYLDNGHSPPLPLSGGRMLAVPDQALAERLRLACWKHAVGSVAESFPALRE